MSDANRTRYFELIRRGRVDELRTHVSSHPECLSARAGSEEARGSGLHVAIGARQPEAGRALVDAGIDVELKNAEGRTALHDSIEYGCAPITELLLERGAYVDVCSAAILGHLERLRQLLDGDPALVRELSTGLTPLEWASYGNEVDTATELLERGADPNDGSLLCAASVNHLEVGRLLLEHGAEPSRIPERCNGNALHAAAGMAYSDDTRPFVEMLFEHGVDPGVRTRDGRTALEIAETRAREQELSPPAADEEESCRHAFAELAELLRARA